MNTPSLGNHPIHLLPHTHTTFIHFLDPDILVDNIVMRKGSAGWSQINEIYSFTHTIESLKCATKFLHHHDLLYILNKFIKNSTWCVNINLLNKWAFFNGNKLYLLIKQICVPRHSNKYQTYWLILKIQNKFPLNSGKTSSIFKKIK